MAKYWTQKRPKNNVLAIENKKAVYFLVDSFFYRSTTGF
ncbi:hypothetical protein HMPREF1320_0726 [Capnocytophaga sp. oral taxon 335 str. F0486]|nr:hypothetical protein HMPREF1320_0726 [Capnocytophaga sp. oral taxon 335 str. F0486]